MARNAPVDPGPPPGSRAYAPAYATHPRALGQPITQTDSGAGEWERWACRHRRELYPVGALVFAIGAAARGHMYAPDLAWLPLAAIPPAVFTAYALRRLGRWGAVGAAALLGWTAAAWSAGIDNSPVAWSLLVLGGPGLVAWWRYQSPRSKIEIVGGSRLPWRWERWLFWLWARHSLGSVRRRWATIAAAAGMKGATLRKLVAAIDDRRELHVDLRDGQSAGDIVGHRLHSALREFPVWVEVPDPGEPWRIVLAEVLEPDEEVGEDEAPALSLVPDEPEPEHDEEAVRLERLLAALRQADGPISGRKAAKLAGLPHDWTWRVGLPELAHRGAIRQTPDKKWEVIDAEPNALVAGGDRGAGGLRGAGDGGEMKTDAGWEPARVAEEAT